MNPDIVDTNPLFRLGTSKSSSGKYTKLLIPATTILSKSSFFATLKVYFTPFSYN